MLLTPLLMRGHATVLRPRLRTSWARAAQAWYDAVTDFIKFKMSSAKDSPLIEPENKHPELKESALVRGSRVTKIRSTAGRPKQRHPSMSSNKRGKHNCPLIHCLVQLARPRPVISASNKPKYPQFCISGHSEPI